MWAPSDSFTSSQIQSYRSVMSVLAVPLGQDNALSDTANPYDDSGNPNLIADSSGSNSSSSGSNNASSNAFMHCLHILCGHESAITAISYSSDMDLVVSGSKGTSHTYIHTYIYTYVHTYIHKQCELCPFVQDQYIYIHTTFIQVPLFIK